MTHYQSYISPFRTLAICLVAAVLFSCNSKENSGTEDPGDTDSSSQVIEQEKDTLKDSDEISFPDPDSANTSSVPDPDWPKISIKDLNLHPPLDGPLLLSGSFGELRGNHFHAGLDIRTGGQEGANVYAIEAGVISRIKVSTRGYGKVLYIRHKNGITSVYGHLKKFAPSIQKYVEKRQYEKRSYAIELFPGNALKVQKGQIIALSGNTGGSAGPHLHFETRSSRTENTINPILYGVNIQDKITPIIYSIILYEKNETYRDFTGNFPYKIIKTKKGSKPLVKLPPGTYACGSQNRDHQLDRLNKLGINYSRLIVNGKEIFNSQIEKFAFDKSRYIQMHYDYHINRKSGASYTKLFLDKKNPLNFYRHQAKGWLNLKHGDTLKARVEISDLARHTQVQEFTLIGDSTSAAIPKREYSKHSDLTARSWRDAHYQKNGLGLDIPSRAMYYDAKMKISSEANKYSKHSRIFHVHKDIVPLHTYYTVRLKVDNLYGVDPSKLLIVNVNKWGGKVSEGGTYRAGWMATKTRSFGNYYVGHDTVAPNVKVKISNRNIYATVSDNLAGVDRYIASIDDQWILVEYHPNMKKMIGVIPDWVKPGEHTFELKVWDERNNKTHKKFKISVK